MAARVVAVIEGDDTILGEIVACLEGGGYRTLPYRRGAGAYAFIAAERPDAVVLDIRLEHPRAGLAVVRRLRRDPGTAALPVVVCTADGRFVREWRRTLADLGCAVIGKPSPSEDLLAAVGAGLRSAATDGPAPPPGNGRAKGPPPAIRPVIALVDAGGRGVTGYTEQLERKGYTVVACRWGDGIFDMAVREQPDLLVVGGGDARRWLLAHALRRLRGDPLTRDIRLLVDPPQDGGFYRLIEGIVGPAPAPERAAPRRWP